MENKGEINFLDQQLQNNLSDTFGLAEIHPFG